LWPEVVEHHGNDPVATAPGSDFVYPHSGHIVAIRVLTQSLMPRRWVHCAFGLGPWFGLGPLFTWRWNSLLVTGCTSLMT